MKYIFAFFLITVLWQYQVFAQLKTKAIPVSEQLHLSTEVPKITLPKPVFNNPYRAITNEPVAEFAGNTEPFDSLMLQKGIWEKASNGVNIWRLRIDVKKARKINIYFSDFYLLNDDLLFLYAPERPIHYALTAKDNGEFLTSEIVKGNSIIIELNRVSEKKQLPFIISEIGVISDENRRDFGGAGDCEVPVNCSEGEAYKKQKNGISRILVKEGSGLFWCTGSLINNTKNNGKEYLLTANHCGQNATVTDYYKWLFYFNYESADCSRPSTEPEIHSLSGARLLSSAPNSTSTGSDFKLLLLNQTIPASYTPYFNGWNHNGNISNTGVTIHHPEGDIKMISTYTTPLVPVDYYGSTSNANGYFWKVQWASTINGHGVTEGGSSGSPLFNADGLIIGALTGGDASCNNSNASDYYGRLWWSWEPAGSDSTGQLAYWLNPDNLSSDEIAGYDPYAGEAISDFTATITQIPQGGKTVFKNLSSGNITGYHWVFSGGNPSVSDDKTPPVILYNKRGKYSVELTVTYNGGTKTETKQNYIEVLPAVYPNPTNTGFFNIRTGYYNIEKADVHVFDETGREIGIFSPQFTPSLITINLSNQKRGLYLVLFDNGEKIFKYKILSTISQ